MSSVFADSRPQRRRALRNSTLAIAQSMRMLLATWRERSRVRRELAVMSDRDLHDMGKCWPEIVYEASKPFWRK